MKIASLRMLVHYQTLLEAVAADPDETSLKYRLLTAGERQQIVVDWNRTEHELSQRISALTT